MKGKKPLYIKQKAVKAKGNRDISQVSDFRCMKPEILIKLQVRTPKVPVPGEAVSDLLQDTQEELRSPRGDFLSIRTGRKSTNNHHSLTISVLLLHLTSSAPQGTQDNLNSTGIKLVLTLPFQLFCSIKSPLHRSSNRENES